MTEGRECTAKAVTGQQIQRAREYGEECIVKYLGTFGGSAEKDISLGGY